METLAFVDTETTGLEAPGRHHVWDIAVILRKPGQPDVEYSWFVRPDLTHADPNGLRIGKFYDKFPERLLNAPTGTAIRVLPLPETPEQGQDEEVVTRYGALRFAAGVYTGPHTMPGQQVAAELATLLNGAYVIGAVPWFDEKHLQHFMTMYGQTLVSHYHLGDVESMAAGQLRMPPPWNFTQILAEYGLAYDEKDRHTAIGDARMARDLYDKIMQPV